MTKKFLPGAVIALLVFSTLALAQHEKPRFHGSAPGHKVDYQGMFNSAKPLKDSPEGQALWANCLQAYGGTEHLNQLTGFRHTSEMTQFDGQEPTIMDKTLERGRKYRVVEGVDTRLINGNTCWYEHEDQVVELNDTRYRAELFSYLTLGLPLSAETENFDQVRYSPRDNDGLGYFYFEKADSLLMIVGVDPEKYVIKNSTGLLPQGETTFVFINEFSGHRMFDGYLFPEETVYYSLGMRVGTAKIKSIEINPDFGADEFKPRNRLDGK